MRERKRERERERERLYSEQKCYYCMYTLFRKRWRNLNGSYSVLKVRGRSLKPRLESTVEGSVNWRPVNRRLKWTSQLN